MRALHFPLQAAYRLPVCLSVSVLLHVLLMLPVNQLMGNAPYGSTQGLARKVGVTKALTAFLVTKALPANTIAASEVFASSVETASDSSAAESAERVAAKADEEPEGWSGEEGQPQIVPLPMEPRYFRPSELTRKPRILEEVSLAFPTSVGSVVAGKMILRLLIGESGRVDKVIVEQTELPESFQASAINSFSQATFLPGTIEDVPVKSQMRIEVSYETEM
jgi:hypothetical protein